MARTGAAVPAAGAVRSTLTVADDGRAMTALWERADDGATWEPWMDMRFTRAPAPDPGAEPGRVRQLRLVVETDDFDEAVGFFREAVGMGEQAAFEGEGEARVAILEAGRATLELANPAQSAMIDQVEVGRRASPECGWRSRSTTPAPPRRGSPPPAPRCWARRSRPRGARSTPASRPRATCR